MKKIIKKYQFPIASTISSILSVFLAIFSNYLYEQFTQLVAEKFTLGGFIFVGGVFVFVTLISFFVVACMIQSLRKKVFPEFEDDRYMRQAFLQLRNLGGKRQKEFQELLHRTSTNPSNQFLVDESFRCMQLTVECCYDFFQGSFSKIGELIDDIQFEVTYMTKSYIDNEITIPCSANKEHRTPVSMVLRKDNPQIFNNTETAKIYSMDRPAMILIEDTIKDQDYISTYENQKARIRSTLILPILSHHYELLGTLVVHCNQSSFFKRTRYDFWKELLEMFSSEIGYYKLLIDYYISNDSSIRKPF